MRKQIAFLSTAAAVLMMAGTAHAEGGGYVGVSYADSKDTDINAWTVDGAFQIGSNIQIDGGYTNIHDSAADEFQLGGHFFSRGSEWLWGGYVGYDRISGSGSDVDEWTVAGQTQYYADSTVLSGDLSYSQVDLFGATVNTTQLSGDARFFANENLSAHVHGGYGRLSGDLGDANLATYGGGLEWQPTSMPISLFGDVDVIDPEGTGNVSTWSVGIRYNWGGSIQDRYHNGAGLDSPRGLLALFL